MKRIIPVLIASLSMVAMAGASAAMQELKAVGLTVGDMANPFFVAMARKKPPRRSIRTSRSRPTKYDLNTAWPDRKTSS